jgi:Arc/MetJ-type ribon-helix-helix transcriptional regulator
LGAPGSVSKEVTDAAKLIKRNGSIANAYSTTWATVNEAQMEGNRSRDDFIRDKIEELESKETQDKIRQEVLKELHTNPDFNNLPQEEQNRILQEEIQKRNNQALSSIYANAIKAGNYTFAFQSPVLLVSNGVFFTKAFRSGFTDNRTLTNSFTGQIRSPEGTVMRGAGRVVGESGKLTVKGAGFSGKTYRIAKDLLKRFVSEGVWEEGMQNSVVNASHIYAGDRTYMGFGMDPRKKRDFISA